MTTNRREPRRMDQTAAGIAARREALEAAGREEWVRATREGRNVQARTSQELRELGARVLAQKSGKAGGLDEAFVSGRGPKEPVVVTAEAVGPDIERQDDEAAQRLANYSKVQLEPTLGDRIQGYPGSRIYARIEADWDPARSNGVTAMPTDAMLDAGEKYKGTYKVDRGAERLGFLTEAPDGSLSFQPPVGGKTKTWSSDEADYARGLPPQNAKAGLHWHRAKGSKGFVDNLDRTNKYFGDMQYLQRGNPMGTVFDKEVAWHGLDNGRAIFMYPAGTMSQKEIDEKQRNLNEQQKRFYKK